MKGLQAITHLLLFVSSCGSVVVAEPEDIQALTRQAQGQRTALKNSNLRANLINTADDNGTKHSQGVDHLHGDDVGDVWKGLLIVSDEPDDPISDAHYVDKTDIGKETEWFDEDPNLGDDSKVSHKAELALSVLCFKHLALYYLYRFLWMQRVARILLEVAARHLRSAAAAKSAVSISSVTKRPV